MTEGQETIVMELMDGNLQDLLYNKKIPLSWHSRITFAQNIAGGLTYLHARRVFILFLFFPLFFINSLLSLPLSLSIFHLYLSPPCSANIVQRIHRNINSSNILHKKQQKVKLSDFGVARAENNASVCLLLLFYLYY